LKRPSLTLSTFIAVEKFECQECLQGCQMVYFQTKNPNLGNYWSALDWNTLVYFTAVWSTLRIFGILFGDLVHFVFIWYIFSSFGIMQQEKSGNPECLPIFTTARLASQCWSKLLN
jgi:hypothetical protein